MTPESAVKAKIRKLVTSNGGYIASIVGMGFGKSGVPDLLACVAGHFIAIEAKATAKGRATTLQLLQLEQVREAGGHALIIHADNLGELESLIHKLNQKDPPCSHS